jgi:hypothetical protein
MKFDSKMVDLIATYRGRGSVICYHIGRKSDGRRTANLVYHDENYCICRSCGALIPHCIARDYQKYLEDLK